MVTSFYISEGVKKRKILCPFFYYLIAHGRHFERQNGTTRKQMEVMRN